MPGAPFGSTKSASSHTHHPTGHVAIMAMGLSSPVNQQFPCIVGVGVGVGVGVRARVVDGDA